jgi:hypothetical protein
MAHEAGNPMTSRGLALAAALLLPACQIQRAPSNARPSQDDRGVALAVHAAATPAPAPVADHADEPTAGADPVPGSDIARVHATVLVRAPLARVREVIFDCPHYPEFLKDYHKCVDEGPTPGGGHAWRMDIVELGGLIKLWIRAEIGAPTVASGVETYDGRYLEGNVRAFASRWRLEPVPGGDLTRLTLESHMDPKLPLPSSLINGGSVDGIKDAILAIKRRAEASP